MKIYDYTDDICEVHIFGPIFGAWQSFHRFIASRLFGEGVDQLLKEPEKKLHNAFVVAAGHQQDPILNESYMPEDGIQSEVAKMRRILFSVGNSHLGRFNKEKCIKILTPLNEYLKEHNCYLLLVRGGEDNPSYFNDGGLGLSNIIPLPDYSVVSVIYGPTLLKTNILCVGGDVPIFNKYLKKLENIARQIPGQEDVKMTWEDTGFHFDQSEADKLKDMDIEVLLTSAPSSRETKDSVLTIMDALGAMLKEREDVCKLVNKETLPSLNDWVTGWAAGGMEFNCPTRSETEPEEPMASRVLVNFATHFMLPWYDGRKGALYKKQTLAKYRKLHYTKRSAIYE